MATGVIPALTVPTSTVSTFVRGGTFVEELVGDPGKE
jgi:hypothetical protein